MSREGTRDVIVCLEGYNYIKAPTSPTRLVARMTSERVLADVRVLWA